MKPTPPAGPFTLEVTLRGPEYAVLIPRGDETALLDVCRTLAQMWNGAGALIIPLEGDQATLDRSLAPELDIRLPDQFFTHPALSDELRESASEVWRKVAPWRDSAFDHQVHSWRLARDVSISGVSLPVPEPANEQEALLAAALWGFINPEDLDEIGKQYIPEADAGDDLLFTTFAGQINGLSPLAWGSRSLPTQTVNGPNWRSLYVLQEDAGFDDLVRFWNLRARYPRMPNGSLLVGCSAAVLRQEGRFGEMINRWITEPPRGTKPDLAIDAHEDDADLVRAAMEAAGIAYEDSGKRTTYSRLPADQIAAEYALAQTTVPMELARGLSSDTIVSLQQGVNRVRFPIPTGFPPMVRTAGRLTTIIGGLPQMFPMSDILAQDWHTNAVAEGDRLRLGLGMIQDHITIDLNWATAQTQMSKHMATAGLRAEPSAPGHLADIFLTRISDQTDLDPLALPHALAILEALVVRRSARIAQQLRGEFERSGRGQIDEDWLADTLRSQGLFAQLESKTLAELQGTVQTSTREILPTLARLCESGYVQRGRSVDCPACDTADFWRLAELDDRMTCRACLQEFALPAIEHGKEPATAYRLDALAARVMGFDLVPVLLTLRHFLTRGRAQTTGAWWPGLDLYRDAEGMDRDQEIDLLYAEQGTVWVCEVKLNAAWLSVKQARELCRLAAELRAVPVFSAPIGEWTEEIVELADQEHGLLLGPSELLVSAGSTED